MFELMGIGEGGGWRVGGGWGGGGEGRWMVYGIFESIYFLFAFILCEE